MNYHWCPCGGEVAAGGDAPPGGGQCLSCGLVFATVAAVTAAGGMAAQLCNRRRSGAARCQVQGCRHDMVALCDAPVGNRRTCDLRICSHHRTRVGRNRDRCPEHAVPGGAAEGSER
jgi:hypothetical protein